LWYVVLMLCRYCVKMLVLCLYGLVILRLLVVGLK